MSEMGLGDFIKTVKNELLAYQESQEGEEAFFLLNNVDLEIRFTVTKDANGNVILGVVKFGADVAEERTHTAKLSLGIVNRQEALDDFIKALAKEVFSKKGHALTPDQIDKAKQEFDKIWRIEKGGRFLVRPPGDHDDNPPFA